MFFVLYVLSRFYILLMKKRKNNLSKNEKEIRHVRNLQVLTNIFKIPISGEFLFFVPGRTPERRK